MKCCSSMEVATQADTGTPRNNARLVSAAHEFEASMLSELLKPLQHGALTGDDSTTDGSGSALLDFSSSALGRALSERGGFGIAKRILQHFEPSAAPEALKKNSRV